MAGAPDLDGGASQAGGEDWPRGIVGKPEEALREPPVARLHWGCGRKARPGWINSDKQGGPGIDLRCDIRDGLPLPAESLDYVVSIHALQELAYRDLVPALEELRRVLKPAGVLRLGLPDLDKGIEAYRQNDGGYFHVPDEDARSLGGKLIVQMLWYGHSRSMFTYAFIEELLRRAGFRHVSRSRYKTTRSAYPEIVELDRRERESLFVEAIK